jgi:hypothetical protein
VSAADPSTTTRRLAAHLNRRARWRWPEIVFWLAILVAIFAAPSRAAIINEVLIAGLFALSLDLILGLTGIVSLGHAAFFLASGPMRRRSWPAGAWPIRRSGSSSAPPSPRSSASPPRLSSCAAPT